jgi:hypothetical protein
VEDVQEPEAGDEHRRGHPEQRQAHGGAVTQAVGPQGCEDPGGEAEQQPEHAAAEGERGGHRHSVEDRLQDRLVVAERVAEVGRPAQDAGRMAGAEVGAVQEVEVLPPCRQVEAHAVAH